jgi:hypothetical protein
MKYYKRIVVSIITILTVSFFIIGGCDIDFGTSDDSSGSSDPESIEGTVINVIPSADIEGIAVDVTDPDNQLNISSDVTSASGFFKVTGSFIGIPTVKFMDQVDESLGLINVTVYDDSRIQLGNIRLENGVVILDDSTIITFEGNVALNGNNCFDNVGTITVETLDRDTDVILQISSSTDVLDKNNDSIDCQDFLNGNRIETRGILLLGNTVDAFRVQFQ